MSITRLVLLLLCAEFLSCTNTSHKTVKVHKYKCLVNGAVSYQYMFERMVDNVDYYYWYSTTSPVSDYRTIVWVKTTINPLKGMSEEDFEEDEEADVEVSDLSPDTEADVDASDAGDSGGGDSGGSDGGGGDGGD